MGFSEEDRNENIRRITEVSELFKDAVIITLVSFISPLKSMRKLAKDKIGDDTFVEVYEKQVSKYALEEIQKACIKKQ